MADPVSPLPEVLPWWRHPENISAIVTVAALAMGALGYTVAPADVNTLAGASGSLVAAVVQIVAVMRRVLASKS